MTDADLLRLYESTDEPVRVNVKARDYTYDGWLVAAFPKRGGGMRCVVEDEYGRLFIHNAGQLRRL